MGKKISIGTIIKILILLVVVAVWAWSGWTGYQSCLRAKQPNPELINTFRVVFEPEKISQAAQVLTEKAGVINNLPVEKQEPVIEDQPVQEEVES